MTSTQVASDYSTGVAIYTPPVTGPGDEHGASRHSRWAAASLNLSWSLGSPRLETAGTDECVEHRIGHELVQTARRFNMTETNAAMPITPANGAVFYRLSVSVSQTTGCRRQNRRRPDNNREP